MAERVGADLLFQMELKEMERLAEKHGYLLIKPKKAWEHGDGVLHPESSDETVSSLRREEVRAMQAASQTS